MKKSVLFITPHFYPRLGGVETHVHQVSKRLLQRGWKVAVLTEKIGSDPLKDADTHLQILQVALNDPYNKKEVWQNISRFIKTIHQSDIIHVHDVVWWIFPWLLLVRKKLFITFHGWEGSYPIRWQAKLQRWFFSLFAQGSIHIGDFIGEFYWDSPTVVTYGGVEKAKKITFYLPNKRHPRFVFIGRLEKENAISEYLAFFSRLKVFDISPVITWVGDGSFKSDCLKVGKVTGMVNNPSTYLVNADFVCANSYLSILEAQAVGKIVCSFYPHRLKQRYLETFPGSKLLVMAKEPKAMVAKIRKLLKNSQQMKQLSVEAHAFAQTQTWDTVADVYEKLWQKSR